MLPLPRLAVGTVQPDADSQPILWAAIEALRQQGLQLQSFHSRACLARYHGEATATGSNPRHLDSWLMSAELCREIFIRGAEGCDLALVEGEFGPPMADESGSGGRLDTLCDWLDLPRVVVLDVSAIEDCRLPEPPPQADALLLARGSERRVQLSDSAMAVGSPIRWFGPYASLPCRTRCLTVFFRSRAASSRRPRFLAITRGLTGL